MRSGVGLAGTRRALDKQVAFSKGLKGLDGRRREAGALRDNGRSWRTVGEPRRGGPKHIYQGGVAPRVAGHHSLG